MSLPANWTLVPITGEFVYRTGTPVSGRLIFESKQTVEIDGVLIVPKRIEVQLLPDGTIPAGFALPSTDDPDLSITGWAYRVTEHWPGGRRPYWIFVPAAAAVVDIPTAGPVVPPEDLVDTIQGPKGEKGDKGDTGPKGPRFDEYGVFVANDDGVEAGEYPATRSVHLDAAMTDFYAESFGGDAQVTVLVDGATVHGPVTVSGSVDAAVSIPLTVGQQVTFAVMADAGTTHVWAQLGGLTP